MEWSGTFEANSPDESNDLFSELTINLSTILFWAGQVILFKLNLHIEGYTRPFEYLEFGSIYWCK